MAPSGPSYPASASFQTICPPVRCPLPTPHHPLSLSLCLSLFQVMEFRSLLAQLHRLCSPSSLASASLPAFTWAMQVAMSRSFSLRRVFEAAGRDGAAVTDSGEVPSAFLPFADLFNHAAEANLVTRVRGADSPLA